MSRSQQPTVRELRKFGLSFSVAMTLLGSLLLWRDKAPAPYVLGLAATVFTLAVVLPRALRPLEWLLATIFRAVMTAITYVALTLIFFLVITPIGLIIRLSGKDAMQLRRRTEGDSYWQPVAPDGPASRPDKPF